MKNPGYPRGVPNPVVAHVHPYPTRFHGGIWTRPVFGQPQIPSPLTVFLPPRDIDMRPDKPYEGNVMVPSSQQGLGSLQYDVGEGIFRPGGYGGGLFDGNLSGVQTENNTLGATASDEESYPYGQYSAKTKAFQDKINVYLKKAGLCPITADGKLGPATCGAVTDYRVLGAPGFTDAAPYIVPSTCAGYAAPKLLSSGCGGSSTVLPTPTQSASASSSLPMSSSTKKLIGFVAGGLGAVAVVYYVKKRRAR